MMGLAGGSRKYAEASRLRILGCAGRRWVWLPPPEVRVLVQAGAVVGVSGGRRVTPERQGPGRRSVAGGRVRGAEARATGSVHGHRDEPEPASAGAAQNLNFESSEHQRRGLEIATVVPRSWRERLRAVHVSVLVTARARTCSARDDCCAVLHLFAHPSTRLATYHPPRASQKQTPPRRAPLKRTLLLLATLLLPAIARAAGWTAPTGTTYAELGAYALWGPFTRSGTDLVHGPGSANLNLRLYAETHPVPSVELILNAPLLDYAALGEEGFFRFGDPTAGLRWIALQREQSALSLTASHTFHTQERTLYATRAVPADDTTLYAPKGPDYDTTEAGLHFTATDRTRWYGADLAYAYRGDAADQLVAGASLWSPWGNSPRWSYTVGLVARLNLEEERPAAEVYPTLDPVPTLNIVPAGALQLSNGWGEQAQNVGFYGRADYALTQHLSVGGGLDGGFWYTGYPSGPGLVLRMAWRN